MDEVIQSSVQRHPDAARNSFVMRWASFETLLPSWWTPARDVFLRDYWKKEDFMASTVYSVAVRNSQFNWSLNGLEDDVTDAQQLLHSANFGQGWSDLITKTSVDLLTTDNGAFWEVIRPAKVSFNGKVYPAVKTCYENDYEQWYAIDDDNLIALGDKAYSVFDTHLDLPIGIAHLDSGQCQRTGDPDIPVIYTDRYGKTHRLKWWQVISFTDMASPIEKMNGVGFCAVSRSFRTSHVLQSLNIYKDEKMSGRHNRAIHITNADPDLLNDQIRETQAAANNAGQMRYIQPVIASTFDPSATPSVATIDLAGVPDGFDEETTKNWGIAVLALAFGVDYGFLAPLPGKGLGTATQSETQAKQAKNKSSMQFRNMITQALNFRGIFPESVQFEFDNNDIDAEEQDQKMSKSRAETRKIMIESGEITPKVARQMAVDSGDLEESYLNLMGDIDLTPRETVEGNENVEAETVVEEEIKCTCGNCSHYELKPYKVNNEKIRELQYKFFQEKRLAQKVLDAARNLFRKKQINIPESPSEEVNNAILEYSNELEELVTLAQSGEIEQDAFEEAMQDLVVSALILLYALQAGIPVDEITGADLGPIEDAIAQNQDSIANLSNDIYDGRYEDEEEGLGIGGLLLRMGLWLSSAVAIAWLGALLNPDNAQSKYVWELNPIKENCESCLALDGQVHTGQEWGDFGVYPKSSRLLCNGFNCGCNLRQVSIDTPVVGDLSAVPLN